MRINLRKINQLIREEYEKAKGSYEKSATSNWPYRLAREFFPDIAFGDAMKVAHGDATLRWDHVSNSIVVNTASESALEIQIHAEAATQLHYDNAITVAKTKMEQVRVELYEMYRCWEPTFDDDPKHNAEWQRKQSNLRYWAFEYGAAVLLRACSRLLDSGETHFALAQIVDDLRRVFSGRTSVSNVMP